MAGRQPSARLLEFLGKVDDEELRRRFNQNPHKVFDEYGITADERNAIEAGGEHKGEPRATQEAAVKKTFELLGLDPNQHVTLIQKIVDAYDAAW